MATATEIITAAYREANFKNSLGAPTTEEFSEGLTLLQSLIDSLFGLVVGTKPMQWYIPRPQKVGSKAANYPALPGDAGLQAPHDVTYPPANVRLMMKNTEDVTVYLQYQPQDGALLEYVDVGHTGDVTLDGNGALFGLTGSNEDVVIAALFPVGRNTPRRWVYRGDYGSWLEVSTLDLSSDIPFPTMFDDYFVSALAMRLSPRFGAEPRQITVMRYRQMDQFIRLQYLQTKEEVYGTAGVPTEQSYWNTTRGFDDFNTGGIV
jgi:hypothetical protein